MQETRQGKLRFPETWRTPAWVSFVRELAGIRRGQNIPRDPEYIAFAALVATLEYFVGGPLYQIYLQDHGRGPTGIKN